MMETNVGPKLRPQGMNQTARWKAVVIEDSRTQALQLGSVLERAGFEVHLANDGESGLVACSEILPDVVISDIVMPGIDGFEVCRRLKSDPEMLGIPVVLLTSLID